MPDIEGETAPGFEAVRDTFAANFTDGADLGAADLARVRVRDTPAGQQQSGRACRGSACHQRCLHRTRTGPVLRGPDRGGRRHRVVTPDTLTAATAEHAAGVDRILRIPVRWSAGYALWTDQSPWLPRTMFGFSGLGGSLGFADPATGLAFGYIPNHMSQGMTPDPRAANLVTAVRECHQALAS